MLEKIGLPPKPSVRGNNWVVDASHCQGCSSQFTFINRKHHCRRCGGLFCNSCTQQRMMLRGQGDSPVRICEPCKKLEEAARFEMRYGQKNRTSRGGSKVMSRDEDEILNQILGNDGKEFVSSRRGSTIDTVSGTQRANSIASSSSVQELTTQDEDRGNLSAEETSHPPIETGSASPEELRQQALDEKKKYKNLKAEGKSGEALKAFKRGKELERQAGSLELLLRKNRKKALSSTSMTETQKIKDDIKGSGRINKLSPQMSKDKDDLAAELRDLGWSDMDLRDAEKKPASMSLEGELSSLLGDASRKAKTEKGISGIDKTQVIAHKKRALELKREGNLTEAKEELKRAKVLEKQLEEQEFLADAEDSDDELSSLIRSLDNDKQDDLSVGYKAGPGVDFDPLVGLGDDIGANSNFDVTDEDMDDPEMASALKSLGWAEEVVSHEYIEPRFVPIDREALSHEIQSLKRDAVNQKRAGNTVEAMALLKKAKALEKDLENYDSKGANLLAQSSVVVEKGSSAESAENASKSRRVIQKELLELKKRALALRREGRVDEADEELKKGKVLEQQLEGIDNASKSKPTDVYFNDKPSDSSTAPDLGDEEDGDVTDQDMHDPTYISLLRNLGWNDEDDGNSRIPSKPSKQNKRLSVQISGSSGKSKGEIQRELLGLKRKALALRRHGETEEAEEVLKMTKVLEAQLAEIEAPKKEAQAEINEHLGSEITGSHLNNAVDEGDEVPVSEEDMHDGALLSMLNNLGWKEEVETESKQAKSSEQVLSNSVHSDGTLVVGPKRSKREIQKELLGLKRKALSLRRQGETEEAEEVTRMAKLLEAQMEEIEDPKKELDIDASNKKESETSVSLITDEKHQSLKDVMELNKGLAQEAVYSKEKMIERPTSLRWKEINSDKPRSSDISIEDNRPLLVDLGPPYESKTTEATGQSSNLIDLLTGEDWINPQTSVHNSEDKRNFSPVISSLSDSPIYLESQKSPTIDFVKTEVKVHANEKMSMDEPKSAPVIVSQNDQSTLRQDVLAHKRKAVALKREGKLAEAREELRQAKLLEKSLADEKPKPSISFSDVSSSTSIGQPQQKSSNLAPKPLSGRDRFKLQQESLSHKRLALKLRREGRTEEADAEFELAKALENQLEEFADSNKSGVETVDDVGVEDFLDPQLLSALKAIGLEDPSTVSRGPERVEPSKSVIGKNENSSQERIQLEERIKAEKVKAVNLKRSGKQAEALDSLRKAKVLEKKLNSLASV